VHTSGTASTTSASTSANRSMSHDNPWDYFTQLDRETPGQLYLGAALLRGYKLDRSRRVLGLTHEERLRMGRDGVRPVSTTAHLPNGSDPVRLRREHQKKEAPPTRRGWRGDRPSSEDATRARVVHPTEFCRPPGHMQCCHRDVRRGWAVRRLFESPPRQLISTTFPSITLLARYRPWSAPSEPPPLACGWWRASSSCELERRDGCEVARHRRRPRARSGRRGGAVRFRNADTQRLLATGTACRR